MINAKSNLIAVVIFFYNRIEESTELIACLRKNYKCENFYFCFYIDGPKTELDKIKQIEIENYVKEFLIDNSGEIVIRDSNYGLHNNILSGVTSISNRFDKFIVLEDDLILSPYFLQFMQESLNYYENDTSVTSVSGYNYFGGNFDSNIIINSYADCLGWGTWSKEWCHFLQTLAEDNYAKIISEKHLIKLFNRNNSYPYYRLLVNQKNKKTSWAINWYAHNFIKRGDMVFSGINLIKHSPKSISTNYSTDKYDPLDSKINNSVEPIYPNNSNLIVCNDLLEDWLRTFPLSLIRRILLILNLWV